MEDDALNVLALQDPGDTPVQGGFQSALPRHELIQGDTLSQELDGPVAVGEDKRGLPVAVHQTGTNTTLGDGPCVARRAEERDQRQVQQQGGRQAGQHADSSQHLCRQRAKIQQGSHDMGQQQDRSPVNQGPNTQGWAMAQGHKTTAEAEQSIADMGLIAQVDALVVLMCSFQNGRTSFSSSAAVPVGPPGVEPPALGAGAAGTVGGAYSAFNFVRISPPLKVGADGARVAR